METLFAAAAGGTMTSAVIDTISPDDATFGVVLADGAELTCERLYASDVAPVSLVAGDRVLVYHREHDDRGIIIGRIGPRVGGTTSLPDAVVLEATQQVTLRAGASSVTVRADGKVVTKGKDVVSHATHVNRIKGGAVAIN